MKRSVPTADLKELQPPTTAPLYSFYNARCCIGTTAVGGGSRARRDSIAARGRSCGHATSSSLAVGADIQLPLQARDFCSAALASKSWKSIWMEAQHELPDYCQMENQDARLRTIFVLASLGQESGPAACCSHSRVCTHPIFQKLCDLKNQGQVNGAQKAKSSSRTFQMVNRLSWNRHFGLGTNVSKRWWHSYMDFKNLPGWSIRLNPNLILWTWSHFQKWRKIYFGQPLWDCELAYDSDDDGDVYRLVYDDNF